MKKLSKVLSFTNGLKKYAPEIIGTVAGAVLGTVGVNLYTDVIHPAPEKVVPAETEIKLTKAQKQEVLYVLRELRGLLDDQQGDDSLWVNTQVATKLSLTLGEPISTRNTSELLAIIDAALAELYADTIQTADSGLER